jgi:hypothetical protein
MNYLHFIEENLIKSGWSSHTQTNGKIWYRSENLKKQYNALGFKDNKVLSQYVRPLENLLKADRQTYCVEQVTHALLNRKGYHAGNKSKHGTGWTEIFNVTPRQMQSYKANAIKICKRFNWNFQKITKWLRDFSLKHFGVRNVMELHYHGIKVERTNPCKPDYTNSRYNVDDYKRKRKKKSDL